LALLATFLCLVAQVGGAAHLALVSHVRCFEHDALVHAGTDQAHEAASAIQNLPAGQMASGVPTDAVAHADDHCAVVALRRREECLAPAHDGQLAAPARPSTESAPQACQDEVLVGPVALLRLAPKASPPALSTRC
jgi:hypothetical protein